MLQKIAHSVYTHTYNESSDEAAAGRLPMHRYIVIVFAFLTMYYK